MGFFLLQEKGMTRGPRGMLRCEYYTKGDHDEAECRFCGLQGQGRYSRDCARLISGSPIYGPMPAKAGDGLIAARCRSPAGVAASPGFSQQQIVVGGFYTRATLWAPLGGHLNP